MALKFYWGLEANDSAALGANDYSAGDTTTDTFTGMTIGAAGAKIGSYGLIAASGSNANTGFAADTGILVDSGQIDSAVGSCGYWWQAESAFPGNNLANGFRLYRTAVANGLRVMSVTGSKLRLLAQNPGAEQVEAAPSATLSAGTWYFIVCRWDVPGGKIKLELYTDAGGGTVTPVTNGSAETTSGVANVLNETDFGGAGSAFEFIQFNVKSSGTASRIFTDNIIVCDTYAAPIQNNAFITDDSQYSETTKKLKLLVHADAQSDTSIEGEVFTAPTGGEITGTKLGHFSGKAFEATLEGGKAVLKVPVDDFGGTSLSTSDTPVALVRNANDTTGLIAGTVIEE